MAITAIKNITVITMNTDKELIENGVVIIEDENIIAVGSSGIEDAYTIHNMIDGENGILMPGMINGHTHAPMIAFRSLGDDVPDRMKRYLFPLEKELVDANLVYKSSKYGIAEMLLGGVTTFVDMYFFEDEVAKASKEMGIRAVVGETVVNFPSPDSETEYGGIEIAEKLIHKWKNDSLVTPAIAPHAPYSMDTDKLKKCHQLAVKHDVPLIMHVAEMEFETTKYREEYGCSPVKYLSDIGLLSNKLIAAHCVNVNEEDLRLLKESGTGVIHNAGANSKGAKGIAPVKTMRGKDLKLGLGTDGPMSGNTLDILTQMALVPKIHKLFNNDRSLFPALDIVEMATMGGARALHMDHKIGSIEVGKKADMVLIETKSVNMQPIFDYYSVLVYSANPSNVDLVMVNGVIQVKNKALSNHELSTLQKDILEFKDAVNKVSSNVTSSFSS